MANEKLNQELDGLINDWAKETMEEGWWSGMEFDLARLVRRAYSQGVKDALHSCPSCTPPFENVTKSALCALAQEWEDELLGVAGIVAPEKGRGIHRSGIVN